jgi:hypothetical protein
VHALLDSGLRRNERMLHRDNIPKDYTMRILAFVIFTAVAFIPAQSIADEKMTKAQAQKQCRAEYSTFDAEKRRSRTGYSFEQDIAFCIKQKLRR